MDSRGLLAPPAQARTASWFLPIWTLTCLGWWGLAFYPVDTASPQWLKAAQALCFGAVEGGLPDAGGWINLFAGPFLLLAAFVLAFGVEVRATLGRWRSGGFQRALLYAAAGLMALELAWVAKKTLSAPKAGDFAWEEAQAGPLPEHYPRGFEPLPRFSLVDQRRRRATPESLRGRPTVLAFVYAHCRTVCPFLVRDTLESSRGVARAAFLTLDPWRDTPSSLPALAKAYSLPEDALLLSGGPAEVNRLLSALKVGRSRDESTGELLHPPLIYVLDARGRVAFRFNKAPQAWIREALGRLEP